MEKDVFVEAGQTRETYRTASVFDRRCDKADFGETLSCGWKCSEESGTNNEMADAPMNLSEVAGKCGSLSCEAFLVFGEIREVFSETADEPR